MCGPRRIRFQIWNMTFSLKYCILCVKLAANHRQYFESILRFIKSNMVDMVRKSSQQLFAFYFWYFWRTVSSVGPKIWKFRKKTSQPKDEKHILSFVLNFSEMNFVRLKLHSEQHKFDLLQMVIFQISMNVHTTVHYNENDRSVRYTFEMN